MSTRPCRSPISRTTLSVRSVCNFAAFFGHEIHKAPDSDSAFLRVGNRRSRVLLLRKNAWMKSSCLSGLGSYGNALRKGTQCLIEVRWWIDNRNSRVRLDPKLLDE